jgi:type IV pilus assembly protein PilY1
MNNRIQVAVLSAALAILVAVPARAADTDLFLRNNTLSSTNPNVLIIFDNAAANNANLTDAACGTSKKFPMEQCVINNVLNASKINDKINIGLSLFNPSGASKGGYIDYAVRPMTAANKTALIAKVNAMGTANNAPYAKSMHEAYLYFKGAAPYVGTSSSSYDPDAVSGGLYVSPASDSCQKNYIIYVGNGGPDSSENGDAQTLLTADKGAAPSIISLASCCNSYQQNWIDEFAQFLFGTDVSGTHAGTQNIVTYTVMVDDPTDSSKPAKSARALLNSAATQGGGKYFQASDSATLTKALTDILNEIQAVNSVFAAVTLPVSVNVRGTNLDQVYMGVFRPDADALPRWMGNLKQYQIQLNTSTNVPYLADSTGAAATSNDTGFISANAISYWTSASNFWSFKPNGAGLNSDSPDGDVVEKGATAENLRITYATDQSTRKLYTCTGTCAASSLLSATPFNTSNSSITEPNTGTSSSTDLQNLINWTRGTDIYDENADGSTSDVRASIHGDVLHSRPAVINYNRYSDDNDVFVYYGGNDGIFHAIQGGQIQPTGTPASRRGGIEQWGFIPSEFFGSLKSIRDNTTAIDITLADNPRTPDKTYFADGPIGIYQKDANNDNVYRTSDNDLVYLYLTMRRGGRLLYALDASDPAAPKFLWKKSNTDTGFAELGQSWSAPKPVTLKAYGSSPVVIFGGGYDSAAEDGADSTGQATAQGTATMGRAIMIVDATTGAPLWQAGPSPSGATVNLTVSGMTYDMPADILTIDRDGDGNVDRLYAVDTGANIWRVDCDDANPSNWTITKIASLGGTGANARKFLYRPAQVFISAASGSSQTFDALYIGSGDREHPFDTSVTNRFYMIKDLKTGLSPDWTGYTTITESNLYDTTSNLIQTGTTAEKSTAQAAMDSASGWYITLSSGEKVVGNATVVSGGVYFGTNQPTSATPGVCTNLGTARLYTIDFLNGGAVLDNNHDGSLTTSDRSTNVPGGGFPPSPVPATVILNGKPVRVVISGTQVQETAGPKTGQRYRTYWHNQRDH